MNIYLKKILKPFYRVLMVVCCKMKSVMIRLFKLQKFLESVYKLAENKDSIKLEKQIQQLREDCNILKSNLSDLMKNQKYLVQMQELNAKTITFIEQFNSINFNEQSTPLVSVIMPVWNRQECVAEAIESILLQSYKNWELLIVNDGSTDDTENVIKPFLNDSRIKYFKLQHQGVSAARNYALEKSQGEYIAYLDSDNFWFPEMLSKMIKNLHQETECLAGYCALIWDDNQCSNKIINFPEQLHYDSTIISKTSNTTIGPDLNSFVHHRKLFEQYGGFDTQLDSLTDYEMIYRYSLQHKLKAFPFVGVYYRRCYAKNTITDNSCFWYSLYLVRKKYQNEISKKNTRLKVLYISEDFPQICESYVYNEIEYVKNNGVEVAVWRFIKPTSPKQTDVQIYEGSLSEAIRNFKPDVLHCFWITVANQILPIVEANKLKMTVRCHGFEYRNDVLQSLQNSPAVEKVYIYKHFLKDFMNNAENPSDQKLSVLQSAFNPRLYYPLKTKKDKYLVLRTGAALPTKEFEIFIRIANRCLSHKFVLIIARVTYPPAYHEPQKFIELNNQLGGAATILINQTPEVIADYMRKAGIYFHTYSEKQNGGAPLGMPVSICEAMATGAYLIGRDSEPMRDYIGEAGDYYQTEEEAFQLIKATEDWNEQQWLNAKKTSVDRAYNLFLNDRVSNTLLDDWHKMNTEKEVRIELEELS